MCDRLVNDYLTAATQTWKLYLCNFGRYLPGLIIQMVENSDLIRINILPRIFAHDKDWEFGQVKLSSGTLFVPSGAVLRVGKKKKKKAINKLKLKTHKRHANIIQVFTL